MTIHNFQHRPLYQRSLHYVIQTCFTSSVPQTTRTQQLNLLYQPRFNENPRLNTAVHCTSPVSAKIHIKHRSLLYIPSPMSFSHQASQSLILRTSLFHVIQHSTLGPTVIRILISALWDPLRRLDSRGLPAHLISLTHCLEKLYSMTYIAYSGWDFLPASRQIYHHFWRRKEPDSLWHLAAKSSVSCFLRI